MSNNHLLVWNVRGLNYRARRTAVCDVVAQQRASVVCLQESKIAAYDASLNNETVGQGFDYSFLPATGMAGGAVVAWRRDLWDASDIGVRRFSVTIRLKPLHSMGEPWWLTTVYGPANREDKPEFQMELRAVASACQGPWLVVGDFNLIYKASDKNNGRLHHGIMRRFWTVIDDLHLDELHLNGRLYT